MEKLQKYWLQFVASMALGGGVVLRMMSFGWNGRLHGDVNLFALTAREFVRNGRLFYPMKYEYSDLVAYQALQTPASQHPPLWPFAAGVLGKLFGTQDTYTILKLLCVGVGIAMLGMVIFYGWHSKQFVPMLAAAAGMALSPLLIDFSANGSSYILSALIVLLVVFLLQQFDYQNVWHYMGAGVVCGVGYQVHSALLLLPLAFICFWLWDIRKLMWRGVFWAAGAGVVTLLPWLVWNWGHFKRPFYSYSSYYILRKLNIAHTGLFDNVITTRVTGEFGRDVFNLYMTLVRDNGDKFFEIYYAETGPIILGLAAIGLVYLVWKDRRQLMTLFLPYLFYVLMIILWATYKYRFLVPAIPAAYLLAGIGISVLIKNQMSKLSFALKTVGIVGFLGMLLWFVPAYSENPPTRYYDHDEKHLSRYAQMREMVDVLNDFEPGVVMGFSKSLDGGIETVYWHDMPFVFGRGLDTNEVQKLAADFQVRYVWVDQGTLSAFELAFPDAFLLQRNQLYAIFELAG